jgi:hypothetical protein
MMRLTFIGIALLLCGIALSRAETVSLAGTVKKAGGTTDANGAFSLGGPTGTLQASPGQALSPRFRLEGNCLVFQTNSKAAVGKIEIFASNGKLISSVSFGDLQAGGRNVLLPEITSGITLVRMTIGGESYTRTIVRIGNGFFMKQDNPVEKAPGAIMLSKLSAAVILDTIIAEKDGYTTSKTPIQTYNKKDIAISLDSATSGNTGGCTREALQAAITSYIAAQKAGDPSKMPLASQVKYTQDMKDITVDKSIVKTALPTIDSQRDLLDVDSCRTFSELIVSGGGHPYVIGTRLRVDNGKISEVSTMVTDKDDWAFDATKYISNTKTQTWDVLPADKRSDRQFLINACNAYFDLIFDWTKDTVPWGDQCYRVEGGNMVAKPCTKGTNGNSVKTTCRTFVVDVDKGAINIYCYFGFGPDSHIFRLENKKIVYINTMTACGDTVAAGANCWGTAAKGKAKGYCSW